MQSYACVRVVAYVAARVCALIAIATSFKFRMSGSSGESGVSSNFESFRSFCFFFAVSFFEWKLAAIQILARFFFFANTVVGKIWVPAVSRFA